MFYNTRKNKNIYSVIHNGASRFEAVLLHALAFLDSYKSHHLCEQFSFIRNLLWHGRAEKIYRKLISSIATVKKPVKVRTLQPSLVSLVAGVFVYMYVCGG